MATAVVVSVPEEADFIDDGGGEVAFLEAPELEEIVADLVERHERFAHLAELTVRCLWRRKGAAERGKVVFGTCQKPSGLLRHFTDCDFLVLLNADACRDYGLASARIESVVYHELLHAGRDEKGRPVLRPHDFEGFLAEIAEYGLWRGDLKVVGRSVRQLPLAEELEA